MDLDKNGYIIAKNLISSDAASLVNDQLEMARKQFLKRTKRGEKVLEHDGLVNNSYWEYANMASEGLLYHLTPKMQEITGKNLHPTYTYHRIYYKGAFMPAHKDRPACQYSMTLNLAQTDPWAISITDKRNWSHNVELNPGDALIYKGCECEHWRDVFHGERFAQVFLHWVDADDEFYSQFKYDQREYLAFPSADWKNRKKL